MLLCGTPLLVEAITRPKHASRIPHFHLSTSFSPTSIRSLGETLPPLQPILIPGFGSNANISLQNQMREGKIEMLLLFMFSLKKEGENKALLILQSGFPSVSVVKNLPANARGTDSVPGLGRPLRRKKWQPTPVFLPGKSHGWRNIVGL